MADKFPTKIVYTSGDPTPALNLKGTGVTVAVKIGGSDGAKPNEIQVLKDAGIPIAIWAAPSDGQDYVQTLKEAAAAVNQYGAVAFIAQGESVDQMNAAAAVTNDVTVPKSIVTDGNYLPKWPSGWGASFEMFQNVDSSKNSTNTAGFINTVLSEGANNVNITIGSWAANIPMDQYQKEIAALQAQGLKIDGISSYIWTQMTADQQQQFISWAKNYSGPNPGHTTVPSSSSSPPTSPTTKKKPPGQTQKTEPKKPAGQAPAGSHSNPGQNNPEKPKKPIGPAASSSKPPKALSNAVYSKTTKDGKGTISYMSDGRVIEQVAGKSAYNTGTRWNPEGPKPKGTTSSSAVTTKLPKAVGNVIYTKPTKDGRATLSYEAGGKVVEQAPGKSPYVVGKWDPASGKQPAGTKKVGTLPPSGSPPAPTNTELASAVDKAKAATGGQDPAWRTDPRWTATNGSTVQKAGLNPTAVLEQRAGNNPDVTIFRLADGTYKSYNSATGKTTDAGKWDNSGLAAASSTDTGSSPNPGTPVAAPPTSTSSTPASNTATDVYHQTTSPAEIARQNAEQAKQYALTGTTTYYPGGDPYTNGGYAPGQYTGGDTPPYKKNPDGSYSPVYTGGTSGGREVTSAGNSTVPTTPAEANKAIITPAAPTNQALAQAVNATAASSAGGQPAYRTNPNWSSQDNWGVTTAANANLPTSKQIDPNQVLETRQTADGKGYIMRMADGTYLKYEAGVTTPAGSWDNSAYKAVVSGANSSGGSNPGMPVSTPYTSTTPKPTTPLPGDTGGGGGGVPVPSPVQPAPTPAVTHSSSGGGPVEPNNPATSQSYTPDPIISDPACFPAGTMVLTPRGQMDIAKVRIGDIINSWNLALGKLVPAKVTELFKHENRQTVKLETTGGSVITTLAHRFYNGREWVAVKHLTPKTSYVQDKDTNLHKVLAITPFLYQDVYNLHVDHPDHNYIADKFLVHNRKVE